jgi:hypothetical protein
LDQIFKKLYDGTGILLSIQAVYKLAIMLKKSKTLNIEKFLLKKLEKFVSIEFEVMWYLPAEFLVFTGEKIFHMPVAMIGFVACGTDQ